jgi:hypothetical protein
LEELNLVNETAQRLYAEKANLEKKHEATLNELKQLKKKTDENRENEAMLLADLEKSSEQRDNKIKLLQNEYHVVLVECEKLRNKQRDYNDMEEHIKQLKNDLVATKAEVISCRQDFADERRDRETQVNRVDQLKQELEIANQKALEDASAIARLKDQIVRLVPYSGRDVCGPDYRRPKTLADVLSEPQKLDLRWGLRIIGPRSLDALISVLTARDAISNATKRNLNGTRLDDIERRCQLIANVLLDLSVDEISGIRDAMTRMSETSIAHLLTNTMRTEQCDR